MSISGANVAVRADPARELTVEWTGVSVADEQYGILVVESGDFARLSSLKPILCLRQGVRVPGLAAIVTIPLDAGRIELFGSDSDSRWRQPIAADDKDLTIQLHGQQ